MNHILLEILRNLDPSSVIHLAVANESICGVFRNDPRLRKWVKCSIRLIRRYPSVKGLPSLNQAIEDGDLELVKYLLEERKAGFIDESFESALINAGFLRNKRLAEEMINYLINKGFTLEKMFEMRRISDDKIARVKYLHKVVENQVLTGKYLMNEKVPLINEKVGVYNETPLVLAVQLGDRDLFDSLLRRGANPKCKIWGEKGLLHVAVESLKPEMVQRVLNTKSVDVDETDSVGTTPFHALINFIWREGVRVKKWCEKYRRIRDLLRENGANLETRNDAGINPLETLILEEKTYVIRDSKLEEIEILKQEIEWITKCTIRT